MIHDPGELDVEDLIDDEDQIFNKIRKSKT